MTEYICIFDGDEYVLSPDSDRIELVRCKDCQYYETDHFDMMNGIPIITAHEVCTRWGDGCKTDSNGFCFMGERGEE